MYTIRCFARVFRTHIGRTDGYTLDRLKLRFLNKKRLRCAPAQLDRTRRARVAPAWPLGRRLGRHFSVCRSNFFAPSAQNLPHIQFGSLQPVFSLRTMRCKTFRKKIAKNGPKTGNLKTVQSSIIQKKSALGERASARHESVRRRVVRQGGASRRSPVSSGV